MKKFESNAFKLLSIVVAAIFGVAIIFMYFTPDIPRPIVLGFGSVD